MKKNSVKFWRLERGLSQLELAQAVGLPRYKIQLHEQGLTALAQSELERVLAVLSPRSGDTKAGAR